ncbi:MAG TPA: hypothetical protein VM848_10040 [Acidimicrobiia bacterium]|nr:hypothetical protein [Acidimicrobiia bacterium]
MTRVSRDCLLVEAIDLLLTAGIGPVIARGVATRAPRPDLEPRTFGPWRHVGTVAHWG